MTPTNWSSVVVEVVVLVAITVLVGLGKVPSDVLVALATAAIAGHSMGGQKPPPGTGLAAGLVAVLAATGVGRYLSATTARLATALTPTRQPCDA